MSATDGSSRCAMSVPTSSRPRRTPTRWACSSSGSARAAVKMYTEEVGVSPLEPSGSYAAHVRRTISQGRAFGIVEGGRVVYKSDVGCAAGDACQVQGVWLDPALRGRGLSEPAMAQVARLCQERWPVVSLYVNDYNTRARKLYERIGFDTVGEFATVLY